MKKTNIKEIINQIYETTIVRAYERKQKPIDQYFDDYESAKQWLTFDVINIDTKEVNYVLEEVKQELIKFKV